MDAPVVIEIFEDVGWGFSKMKPIVDEAVKRLQLEATISIICSPVEIQHKGVKHLPALLINGSVIVEGRVPSIFTMPQLIQTAIEIRS